MADVFITGKIQNKPPSNSCATSINNNNINVNKSSSASQNSTSNNNNKVPIRPGKLGPVVLRRRCRGDDDQPEPKPDSDPCLIHKAKRLPIELESDILLRLPAEDVQSCCKYVCKGWRDVINIPYFIRSHTSRIISSNYTRSSFSIMFLNSKRNRDLLSIDFGSGTPTYYHLPIKKSRPQLVGSCNGLLCFYCYASYARKRCFSLYNPVTGAFKVIPQLQYGPRIQSGFGYDSVNDDYKILCIDGLQSYIYSLRHDSWKVIQSESAFPDYVNIHLLKTSSPMVLSNNSLYFTISWDDNVNVPPMTKMIKRFDLAGEFFSDVSLPPDEPDFKLSNFHWNLAPIMGSLHLVSVQDHKSEVWIMKEYEVWTRLISFSRETNTALWDLINNCGGNGNACIEPYAYSQDGREILIGIGSTNLTFVSFNLHTQLFNKHQLSGLPIDWPWFYKSMPWVGSFVSPLSIKQ